MKINIINDLFLLQRLDYFIRTRSTGSPSQLADRLEICERDVFRLLNDLRDQGFPIAYSREDKTYYYTEIVQLKVLIKVGSEKILLINMDG
jgi:predicted DNA-binding transcriptional regulator YafY